MQSLRSNRLLPLASDARGASFVEYILLVVVVALVAVSGARVFGEAARRRAVREADCVSNLDGDCSGTRALGSGSGIAGAGAASGGSAVPAAPARDKAIGDLEALTRKAELAAVTGRPLAQREGLVDAQQNAFVKAWPAVYAELGPNSSNDAKLYALQLIARTANPAYFLGRESSKGIEGNCAYAAATLVTSVQTGKPIEPMAYSNVDEAKMMPRLGVDLRNMGLDGIEPPSQGEGALFTGEPIEATSGERVEAAALARMEEGQLGFLSTYNRSASGEFTEGPRDRGREARRAHLQHQQPERGRHHPDAANAAGVGQDVARPIPKGRHSHLPPSTQQGAPAAMTRPATARNHRSVTC